MARQFHNPNSCTVANNAQAERPWQLFRAKQVCKSIVDICLSFEATVRSDTLSCSKNCLVDSTSFWLCAYAGDAGLCRRRHRRSSSGNALRPSRTRLAVMLCKDLVVKLQAKKTDQLVECNPHLIRHFGHSCICAGLSEPPGRQGEPSRLLIIGPGGWFAHASFVLVSMPRLWGRSR